MLFPKLYNYQKILNLISVFFIGIFIIRFMGELAVSNYGWDLDHEMYFGQRFISGELLYTREMHDKLPFIQILFAIPAYFKSVRLWVILSTSINLIAAYSLRKILKKIICQAFTSIPIKDRNLISNLSTSFYLFSFSNTPGHLHMINQFAAALCILSIHFLVNSSLSKNFEVSGKDLFISGFFAAVVISIRPYYAPSITLLGLWIPFRNLFLISEDNRLSNKVFEIYNIKLYKNQFLFFLKWIISLTLFGIIFNFLPYFLTNNTSIFFEGIQHNSRSLQSQDLIYTFTSQLYFLNELGITVYIICIFSLFFSFILSIGILKKLFFKVEKFKVCRNIAELDIFFLGFLALILLESTILAKHFWSHYIQLFLPFIAFSLGLSLASMIEKPIIVINFENFKKSTIYLFLIFLVIISHIEVKSSLKSIRDFTREYPPEIAYNDINKLIKSRSKKGLPVNFLHMTNMYSHFKAGESRHGFPHAANIKHIGDKKWENLKNNYSVKLPRTTKELCKMINETGPSLIFTDHKSLHIKKCLEEDNSNYSSIDIKNKMSKSLSAFVRK